MNRLLVSVRSVSVLPLGLDTWVLRSSPLDVLIIAHLVRFVKGFFTFFFEPAGKSLTLAPTSNIGRVCTTSPLDTTNYSR